MTLWRLLKPDKNTYFGLTLVCYHTACEIYALFIAFLFEKVSHWQYFTVKKNITKSEIIQH